ncbi:hypothetical protein DFA_10421 [Cavenderia fasciculata]|uniref:Wbp11/ELF5/Saf1 N-terminal domain-containing protein n=1 Tax=Cavenderia fasciculata TaxID=261658 RepID=F4QA60_CACFS|nr:uncharacterized protein DFA_10421 [Cavenderia fasciculata]EGG15579.1 hypothetical protein DFA_10421 [Cavenderia fasciculata]|eukprot:XP_004354321.1 hypothetical protein DFA_10421 [Cavenderia fasciculata]
MLVSLSLSYFMGKKDGKGSNPLEVYKKEQKKQELFKHKSNIAKEKTKALSQRDLKELQNELKFEKNKDKRQLLINAIATIKKRDGDGNDHGDDNTPDTSAVAAAPTGPTQQELKAKELQAAIAKYGPPEESIYYDAVYNPYGIPPPGKPNIRKPPPGVMMMNNNGFGQHPGMPYPPPPHPHQKNFPHYPPQHPMMMMMNKPPPPFIKPPPPPPLPHLVNGGGGGGGGYPIHKPLPIPVPPPPMVNKPPPPIVYPPPPLPHPPGGKMMNMPPGIGGLPFGPPPPLPPQFLFKKPPSSTTTTTTTTSKQPAIASVPPTLPTPPPPPSSTVTTTTTTTDEQKEQQDKDKELEDALAEFYAN